MGPSTLAKRTFHPYYVSSPLQRWILKWVIPALAIFVTVFAGWFLVRLPTLVPGNATESQRQTAFLLLMTLGLLVGTMPVPFYWLWYWINRSYLRHTITVDAEGLVQRKGNRERRCAWHDINRVTMFTLGRVQSATLHTSRGKIRFEAAMVDRDAPQPRRVFDMRHEYLEYPDGTQQRLAMDDNELFQLVCEQVPPAAQHNLRSGR